MLLTTQRTESKQKHWSRCQAFAATQSRDKIVRTHLGYYEAREEVLIIKEPVDQSI